MIETMIENMNEYIKWIVLAVAAAMYALIVILPEKKSFAACGAALVMLILRVITPLEAVTELINWTVLMIFIGSLVIAELFIYSRVPAVIADRIVAASPNAGVAIVVILMMTGIISAFVENVATVLVMAPIALALCAKLRLNPTYFMVGLAVMANLQGTATLVGDPPSMIFADFAGYGFNDFFVFRGLPSIFFAVQIGMVVGAVFFYAYFARTGKAKLEIEAETVLTLVPTGLLALMIVGLAACSFMFGGLTVWSGLVVMALALAGLVWYKAVRRQPAAELRRLVKELDWDTTLFLAGIFIVVGAIESTGILDDFSLFLEGIVGGRVLLGYILILVVSVAVSGFVDNVPYIIVMLPVAARLAADSALRPELYMFALLVGSCMGGNLTPFGASANIVTIGIINKEKKAIAKESGAAEPPPVSFAQWLRIGAPFTLLTTAAAALFVWLIWR
jgi:Na+/H+ antiporter NhaD/arsenite permease-like protein